MKDTQPPGITQYVEARVDPRKEVAVLNGGEVKLTVVNAKTYTTFRLFHHHNIAILLGSNRANHALTQEGLDLFVNCLHVLIWVAPQLLTERSLLSRVYPRCAKSVHPDCPLLWRRYRRIGEVCRSRYRDW